MTTRTTTVTVTPTATPTALQPLSAEHAAAGVLSRFAQIRRVKPDAVAVVDDRRSLTYDALEREAARVYVAVASRTEPGAPVAVLHGHEVGAVAAILGVIASQRPVLVLDPRTPAPRLAMLCERAGVTSVLAADDLVAVADDLGVDVVPLVSLPPGEQPLPTDTDPSAPAVLAFTSGSTGVPKIVVNDQRMLVADAFHNSYATGCYGEDDVVAHTLPMAFHAGLMVTIAGLVVGSTMRLYDTRAVGIASLASWIGQVGATVMHTSPAILRAFVGSGPASSDLVALRSVTIAGEPAHGRDVERLRPLLPPACVIRNRYGSSETGLIAEYPVSADHPPLEGPLPVGLPVGETALTCVAENGEPLPAGEPGIVTVTRRYLASGYWNDPDATAAAFSTRDGLAVYRTSDVGLLEDGALRLLGRRDHSVKIRGYLVEPGEVDAALFTLPDVPEALTVGVPRPDSDRYRLVSYVVSTADRPSATAIRSALRELLPGHLVPEIVVFLAALPRTERGKLDRAALPAPPDVHHGEPPITEWERLVAQVWERALDLDGIGREADFFELGGDSLAAEELTAMVVSDLALEPGSVSSTLLVSAPTLAEYARRLKRKPDRRHPVLTHLAQGEQWPPLFIVAGGGGLGVGFVPVVRHLRTRRSVYAFHSHGLERKAIPDWTIPAAARRNLRLLRNVQPHGPYHLAGHSFGGLVALEMAQQLLAAGEEVAVLIELDSFPPDPRLIPGPNRPPGRRFGALRDLAGLVATGLVPTPGLGQFWRFHEQSRVLSTWYRTAPYPGRTRVLLAESEDRDARSQWGPHLSGDWTLTPIPGDHITMLRDPYARRLAEVIDDVLLEVDEIRGAKEPERPTP